MRAFTERTVHDHFFALPDQLPEPQRREAFRAIFEKVAAVFWISCMLQLWLIDLSSGVLRCGRRREAV